MTDEKAETWSPFGMSKVRSRPESPVADLFHARAAVTGKARSDQSTSVQCPPLTQQEVKVI